jgi:hypothetical protein
MSSLFPSSVTVFAWTDAGYALKNTGQLLELCLLEHNDV